MVAGDRGQLVLVGAIAIGIVLIAMTTVLNSAVFTENVAQGDSVEVAGDVREFDRGVIRDARSLAIQVNHDSEYENPGGAGATELSDDLKSNVTAYSHILAESYADTGSVYVNVSYRDETMGGRILQDADGDFGRNPGMGSPQSTWTVVSDPFRMNWFVVNVDVENTSQTDPTFIELTDTTGSELNVSLRQTSEGDLDVRSSIDGGSVSDVTCESKNGRVLVDVVDGTTYTGDCLFNSTEHLESSYDRLRFVNGDDARGKYDLVVNRSDPSAFPNAPACASVNDPCRTVAAWSVDFTTHYRTGSVGYERNHTVEVYGG